MFVVEATSDTEANVEVGTAQEDEGDENDDDENGGEMDTDTSPLRARAHRPRQAVTIRRDTEYRIHCHVKPLHKATR